jgi:hypothetical protein
VEPKRLGLDRPPVIDCLDVTLEKLPVAGNKIPKNTEREMFIRKGTWVVHKRA